MGACGEEWIHVVRIVCRTHGLTAGTIGRCPDVLIRKILSDLGYVHVRVVATSNQPQAAGPAKPSPGATACAALARAPPQQGPPGPGLAGRASGPC